MILAPWVQEWLLIFVGLFLLYLLVLAIIIPININSIKLSNDKILKELKAIRSQSKNNPAHPQPQE